MPYLVVKWQKKETHRIELTGPITVGRDLSCQVWIADEKLSRHHCQICVDEKGRWLVKDLGSRNGIYLNGERVKGFYARDGESFEVGNARLTYYAEALPVQRPATPNDMLHESLMTPIAKVLNGRAAHAKIAHMARPMPVPSVKQSVKLVAGADEPLVKPFGLAFQRPTPRVVMPRVTSPTPAAKPKSPATIPEATPSSSSTIGLFGSMLRTLRLT